MVLGVDEDTLYLTSEPLENLSAPEPGSFPGDLFLPTSIEVFCILKFLNESLLLL
jgi:hypothetical protein